MSNITKKRKIIAPSTCPILGVCPACGADVFAGIDFFSCRNHYSDQCEFSLRRRCLSTLGKTMITNEEMVALLKGKVINLDDLIRKDGERFSCGGILEYDYASDWWRIRFVKWRVKQSSPGLPDRRRKKLS